MTLKFNIILNLIDHPHQQCALKILRDSCTNILGGLHRNGDSKTSDALLQQNAQRLSRGM